MHLGPRRRPLLLAATLLAVVLAGCAQLVGPGPGADGDDGDADPRVMELPEWTLGDRWTFDITVPGFDQPDVQMTYAWDEDVRRDDDGDVLWKHYMLGASQDHAIFHALFDVNPFLGRIHSDVLSPHEEGGHSTMYVFPLEPPEKEWDGAPAEVFFGKERHFVATYSDSVPSPDGPKPGYEIVATAPDGSTVTYNYVADVKWLTRLEARDADGELFVRMELTDHSEARTGTYYFVRSREFFKFAEEVGTGFGQEKSFEVRYPPGDYDAYGPYSYLAVGIHVEPQGDLGRVDVRILDPDGDERFQQTVTADDGARNFIDTIPPQGDELQRGEWTVELDVLQSADVQIEVVGAWEFSETI